MSQALSSHDKEVLNRIFNSEDLEDYEENNVETNISPEVIDAEILQQEIAAVNLAETKNYEESLKTFDLIINQNPNYASAYNNRAQVYQLAKRNEDAMRDLNKALELNGGTGKVGIQALTQRGILHKLLGDDKLALADWEKASGLGGHFARRLAINNNPYAALCNQMLSTMISDERCKS